MSDTVFWALEDEERLAHDSPDDAIEEFLDMIVPPRLETEDWSIIPEKVKVLGFKRMEVDPEICRSPLEHLIEYLDEEFGDPDGGWTKPSQAMKDAEMEFIRKVLSEYEVWQCEPSGEVVEVNCMDWIKENHPEWLEGGK